MAPVLLKGLLPGKRAQRNNAKSPPSVQLTLRRRIWRRCGGGGGGGAKLLRVDACVMCAATDEIKTTFRSESGGKGGNLFISSRQFLGLNGQPENVQKQTAFCK
jgi:hypothetical protein